MTKNQNKEDNYLDTLYHYLFIKEGQVFKEFDHNLTNIIKQIILTGRNSFLLLFINQYFIKDDIFTQRIPKSNFSKIRNVIAILISENINLKQFDNQTISTQEILRCQELIRKALSGLKVFGLGIHHFFLPQKQTAFKSEYFGTVIFPSLFGFFAFSEMIESAYKLLMITMILAEYEYENQINICATTNFSNGAYNDAEGVMFSSFFNGFPHFTNSFCRFFIKLVNQYSTSFHTGSVHEFICRSLNYSCQYLAPHHIKLIKYIKSHRSLEFFKEFFMTRVLQNNLNMFLDSDNETKCLCSKSKNSIIELFQNFTKKIDVNCQQKIYMTYIDIIENSKTSSYVRLSLEKKFNRFQIFMMISGFDERIIYAILKSSNCFNSLSMDKDLFSDCTFKPYYIEFSIFYCKSPLNKSMEKEVERSATGPNYFVNNDFYEEEILSNEEEEEEEKAVQFASDKHEDQFMVKYPSKKNDDGFIFPDIISSFQSNQRQIENENNNSNKNNENNYNNNNYNNNNNDNNYNNYKENDDAARFYDHSFFKLIKFSRSKKEVKFLIESEDSEYNARNYNRLRSILTSDLEHNARSIETYITIKQNESQLSLMYLTFKKRQELFLSFLFSIITHNLTFKDSLNTSVAEQYMNYFSYRINSEKSSLLNPYFELMSYKEVYLLKEFDDLLHKEQLLQKYKEFFDSKKEGAETYIEGLELHGKRMEIIDEMIVTLENLCQVPINDQILVLADLVQRISQIAQSLDTFDNNTVDFIFLFIYLKAQSDAVLPTFLTYAYLFNYNELFLKIMNELDPLIKKAIDVIQKAILNIFLGSKIDLKNLIENFISP